MRSQSVGQVGHLTTGATLYIAVWIQHLHISQPYTFHLPMKQWAGLATPNWLHISLRNFSEIIIARTSTPTQK